MIWRRCSSAHRPTKWIGFTGCYTNGASGRTTVFRVQLALLTKAQWRVAANLPRLMNDASKLIEKHLAEYRRQTGALVANFDDTTSSTIAAFDQSVANHSEAIKQAVAKSNGHLVETEKAARQGQI